jgi:hypothetical protein
LARIPGAGAASLRSRWAMLSLRSARNLLGVGDRLRLRATR